MNDKKGIESVESEHAHLKHAVGVTIVATLEAK